MIKRIINTGRKKLNLSMPYKQNGHFKPKGLWYGIDNEWLDWCSSEMKHWIKKYNIEIEVNENKLLIIETKKQLKDFEKRFGTNTLPQTMKGLEFIEINWKRVTECYSGIELRNYHAIKYSRDFAFEWSCWFYAWDVSSGCIWDLSIINSYCLIKTKKDGVLH